MPVKWDPGMDQLLLLKILETHELKVDAKKISAAWPTNEGMQPTPRAITERLVKIRANSRAAGAGHFGISSSQSKSASPTKTTSVPPTPSKKNANHATKTGSSPAKRKKPGDDAVKIEEGEDDGVNTTPVKQNFVKRLSSGHQLSDLVQKPESLSSPVKGVNDPAVDVSNNEGGSPSKRPRHASAQYVAPFASDGIEGAERHSNEFDLGWDGTMDEEMAV